MTGIHIPPLDRQIADARESLLSSAAHALSFEDAALEAEAAGHTLSAADARSVRDQFVHDTRRHIERLDRLLAARDAKAAT